MSIRHIEIQYIGNTLYLPPLEREVKHIIVRNVKDWEHFEKENKNEREGKRTKTNMA